MRRTRHTYWLTVGGDRHAPTVSFERGPDRPVLISSYGTSFVDPNRNAISILGGQPPSAGTFFPANSLRTEEIASDCTNPPADLAHTQFAGSRGSRKLETFHASKSDPPGGRWTIEEDFLGDSPQDDRTMHYAIVLPTRQVLVIGGGNFDFYGPVKYPLLLTPTFTRTWFKGTVFKSYTKTRLSEGVEPRLYHNTAVLLPDARIFVSGGNTTRAMVHTAPVAPADPGRAGQPLPDLSLVDLDRYFVRDGPQGKGEKGTMVVPSETWVAEIFNPPYLFIDPGRRSTIVSIAPSAPGPAHEHRTEIGGKTFFLLHSNVTYDVALDQLPESCTAEASLVLIKLASATHGWQNGQHFVDLPFRTVSARPGAIQFTVPDAKRANIPPAFYMLFYVDCRGKPSVARIVRVDDEARSP